MSKRKSRLALRGKRSSPTLGRRLTELQRLGPISRKRRKRKLAEVQSKRRRRRGLVIPGGPWVLIYKDEKHSGDPRILRGCNSPRVSRVALYEKRVRKGAHDCYESPLSATDNQK